MLGRKFRVGVAMAALALGAGLGSGTAAASSGTARHAAAPVGNQSVSVLSDTIGFSGVATPAGAPGSYTLNTQRCTLTSDGESAAFPCFLPVTFSLATLMGNGQVNSADGSVVWSFKLTPTGGGNYAMNDTCSTSGQACFEAETENGTSYEYFANVSGTWNIMPIPGTPNLAVNGKINVFESPTAP